MLERPPLSDETIAHCLQSHYRISVGSISFLPIGYDATASVFRVIAQDGTAYFLKTKNVPPAPASLAIPSFLRGSGVEQVVAPLLAADGMLTAPVGDGYTAILYPFVEGRMGAKGGLSPNQWTEFGQIVRRFHSAQLPPALAGQMRREPFAPLKGELAWALHREIASATYADPIHQELAKYWRARGVEIEKILRRAEDLGRMAQARQPEIVLCHADIHIFNVLVAPDERIYVIDWDETILAPKERDLMFLVDGTQPDGEALHPNEAAFRQGYGPTEVDPVILAFYRYEWAVQEIAEFGKQVLWSEDGSEITRLDGLRHFRALFDPGSEVEEAYRTDLSSQRKNL